MFLLNTLKATKSKFWIKLWVLANELGLHDASLRQKTLRLLGVVYMLAVNYMLALLGKQIAFRRTKWDPIYLPWRLRCTSAIQRIQQKPPPASLQTVTRINGNFIRITVIASLKCESAFTETHLPLNENHGSKFCAENSRTFQKSELQHFSHHVKRFCIFMLTVVTPRKGPTQNGNLKNASINPNITLLSACSTAYAMQYIFPPERSPIHKPK